jgi:hypothetical protein
MRTKRIPGTVPVMTLSIREISEFSFIPGFLTDELVQEIDRQLNEIIN